ncbi:PilZ domain-containing protein [Sphingomonas sp. IC-56]|uniref:PilZ domain-containing protein n=1 Tax=Sphingomonas sp. IC-56 TaxID=2898529 RepID=UPI001E436C66|nr:PilZ domain-containing protein [Sphingomonas sp. IC-56]MCD2323371.1 PilZ domain-containing protein [Sphingomonas sp. IC-56]
MSSGNDERRRAPRAKLFQPAEMGARGGDVRVHVLNLSTSGALVYGDRTPSEGEQVRLTCGIALGVGRVAWVSGRRFGVQFLRPLPQVVVEQVLRTQDALIVSASERLGVPCMKMVVPA